ncbi:hypothetical protein ACX3OY_17770 [Citrobacter farmeri]|uniref:hypothetical protein n=1 Tax=Citrobacter farmeri TaxID=67824 RepID=UPI003AB1ED43
MLRALPAPALFIVPDYQRNQGYLFYMHLITILIRHNIKHSTGYVSEAEDDKRSR